jgi:DNA-directed RNA polymerase specialized sigma24 family protein
VTTCFCAPSSNVDGPERRYFALDAREPWWASDPTIAAIRRGVLDEIEQARSRPPGPIGPDPVFVEVASGASGRELAAARDDLHRARLRYADAVRAARVAGYSWGEIGRLLGVSKQSLHRRFGDLS